MNEVLKLTSQQARNRGVKNGSPMSRRKGGSGARKRPLYFSARTTAQLKALAERMTDRRGRAILWMLIESELRPWELLGLSRGQIRIMTADRRDTNLPTAGSGYLDQLPGEPGRKFAIGPKAMTALRDYLSFDRVTGDSGALYTDKTGGRLTIEALMPMIHDWVREAKTRPR